jgi:hypothetical protein
MHKTESVMKALLIKLLNYIEENRVNDYLPIRYGLIPGNQIEYCSGLCSVVNTMADKGLLSDLEYEQLRYYIRDNRPYKDAGPYSWMKYLAKPRIHWLKKHIRLQKYTKLFKSVICWTVGFCVVITIILLSSCDSSPKFNTSIPFIVTEVNQIANTDECVYYGPKNTPSLVTSSFTAPCSWYNIKDTVVLKYSE